MSGRYFSSYDGKTVMADVDVNGNSLELTIEDEKVKAIGNIPVGGGDDSVWTSETSKALSDDNGDDILDENNEVIGDENAETLWVTRDGIEFKAKRAENATNDSEGNQITTTYAKKSEIPPSLPEPPADNVLLAGTATGNKVWQPLAKDTFSSLTEDDGDDIQDEEGNSIGDENSVELWTSFNGIGFGAERAVADEDGNNIIDTYATKEAVDDKADKANITGATKCKITYNGQGIVTDGSDLSDSDIPNLPASKITSGQFGSERIADDSITAAKVKDNETLSVNVTGTATHLSAYGTCDTWDFSNYDRYEIIAETTFDIGSANNGDGSLIQMEFGNSDLVKLKMNFVTRTDTTPAVVIAKVLVLESTQSLSWIKENIIITYRTPTTDTVNIRIYVQFTGAYQVWRARQLDCQTGDVGYTNWRPWTFYQTHGSNKDTIVGTRATYILTSPIISTARAYFNNETGYRRLVRIAPSLTSVGDRVIKFSAIQTWAGALPKTYEGVIDIRYGSPWAWDYARVTKFSSNAGNIVLWYDNTNHVAYLVARCEGSYSAFNLRIEECLDLNGVDKSEDITEFYTDRSLETYIPSEYSELTGT